jgi:hypothetical protein
MNAREKREISAMMEIAETIYRHAMSTEEMNHRIIADEAKMIFFLGEQLLETPKKNRWWQLRRTDT